MKNLLPGNSNNNRNSNYNSNSNWNGYGRIQVAYMLSVFYGDMPAAIYNPVVFF